MRGEADTRQREMLACLLHLRTKRRRNPAIFASVIAARSWIRPAMPDAELRPARRRRPPAAAKRTSNSNRSMVPPLSDSRRPRCLSSSASLPCCSSAGSSTGIRGCSRLEQTGRRSPTTRIAHRESRSPRPGESRAGPVVPSRHAGVICPRFLAGRTRYTCIRSAIERRQ